MEEVAVLDERNGGGNKMAQIRWLAHVPEGERPTQDSNLDTYKKFIERAYIEHRWAARESQGQRTEEEGGAESQRAPDLAVTKHGRKKRERDQGDLNHQRQSSRSTGTDAQPLGACGGTDGLSNLVGLVDMYGFGDNIYARDFARPWEVAARSPVQFAVAAEPVPWSASLAASSPSSHLLPCGSGIAHPDQSSSGYSAPAGSLALPWDLTNPWLPPIDATNPWADTLLRQRLAALGRVYQTG